MLYHKPRKVFDLKIHKVHYAWVITSWLQRIALKGKKGAEFFLRPRSIYRKQCLNYEVYKPSPCDFVLNILYLETLNFLFVSLFVCLLLCYVLFCFSLFCFVCFLLACLFVCLFCLLIFFLSSLLLFLFTIFVKKSSDITKLYKFHREWENGSISNQ